MSKVEDILASTKVGDVLDAAKLNKFLKKQEEEEKEEAKEKTMLTAEEFEKLASEAEKPERAQFERGVVYSKRWGMRGSDES